jgi:hypothetical protein
LPVQALLQAEAVAIIINLQLLIFILLITAELF